MREVFGGLIKIIGFFISGFTLCVSIFCGAVMFIILFLDNLRSDGLFRPSCIEWFSWSPKILGVFSTPIWIIISGIVIFIIGFILVIIGNVISDTKSKNLVISFRKAIRNYP